MYTNDYILYIGIKEETGGWICTSGVWLPMQQLCFVQYQDKRDWVGYQVMVLTAQYPSGAKLLIPDESTLSQISTHPEMMLDVVKKWYPNKDMCKLHK